MLLTNRSLEVQACSRDVRFSHECMRHLAATEKAFTTVGTMYL